MSHEVKTLLSQLAALGIGAGDGLFVHASLRAMGPVAALRDAVGKEGLLGMPGFTQDAILTAPRPMAWGPLPKPFAPGRARSVARTRSSRSACTGPDAGD